MIPHTAVFDGAAVSGTAAQGIAPGPAPLTAGAGLAAAARMVDEATTRVQRQLERVRTLLHRVDPAPLGVSAGRFQALLLGYDVYVRMLGDGLADTAGDLRSRAGRARGEGS